ncbi:sodium:proton antiporter [candidate division LCP-89 bacterium B3_LCP]|uniref:Sodium:proton antiporter n=1 Tax=candidate division LCP-89 bacterium B3_LCP TaxID=2012998 RepID=A0A532UQP7_UNCL8|nr:MAG: sodium:proton antiporter [candidate division LCP-89 bacterium B3_LCP]
MQYLKKQTVISITVLLLIFLLSSIVLASGEHSTEPDVAETAHTTDSLGANLPLWSALPFVGILLSIALFPLFAPVIWHRHFGKISAFWALTFALPFLLIFRGEALYEILHIYFLDYIPFIILLWGLFTASGGILVRGTPIGTPLTNTILLLIGTILASWIGTTGAAMLLIRPMIRSNRFRKYKMHTIVFFIFLVANIGGSLTPLGDPPLFLGFLHGVPFFWTMNLFPHMAFMSLILLMLYFALDSFLFKRAGSPKGDLEVKPSIKIEGLHNLIFLMGIMGAVLMSGMWHAGSFSLFGIHINTSSVYRDVIILLMVFLSVKTTRKQIRTDNGFTWFPIKEVAYLFAGIFMTIIPALTMLRAGENGSLAGLVEIVKEPLHFFWITGTLSSFLDNAPTYLTFFNLSLGRLGLTEMQVSEILRGIIESGTGQQFISILKGISVGAVFFGAVTYIGNAPNFMVRSIAEENDVDMPSFFGYMAWSVGILVPLFFLITWVFFI